MAAYLFGDHLVWTVTAFGVALWLALRWLTGSANLIVVVIGAILLAAFTTDLPLLLARDVTTSLALLALAVGIGQRVLNLTLVQSLTVFIVAWIVGYAIIRQTLNAF